ncbi:MAG: M28 family peptidase [Bdellovibrionia bacterium]
MKFGGGNPNRIHKFIMCKRLRPYFFIGALLFVFGFDYYVLSFERVRNPELPKEGVAARLMESVKTLTQEKWEGRKPKTDGNREAAAWIEDKFRSCGLRSFPSLRGYRQALTGGLGDNVVAYKSAQTKSDRWIVVGAHFDHVGRSGFFNRVHWGADDNASSVAILLEAACSVDFLKDSNIIFVAYNTEEPPYFQGVDMGSYVFVENLPAEIGGHSKIAASISMDLMGGAHWRPLMGALFVVGSWTGEGLAKIVTEIEQKDLSVVQLGYHAIERLPWGSRSPVSDYVPYLDRRVPSILLSVGRTPRYHDPQDTYETLDYLGMERRTRWLLSFLSRLDTFKGAFTMEDAVDLELERQSLKPFVDKAARWSTRVPASSFFTMRNFRRDLAALEQPQNDSDKRILIEHIVGRFECTMMNLPICFLID